MMRLARNEAIRYALVGGMLVAGLALMALKAMLPPDERRIDAIIVHCTATPPGMKVTVDDIDRWHKARGWKGIGYHYVVDLDGTVYRGRTDDCVGAHCRGHNAHSIGVCYVGGLDPQGRPADTRTPEQKEALLKLMTVLKKRYPHAKIYNHRRFANKACPCFDAEKEYGGL